MVIDTSCQKHLNELTIIKFLARVNTTNSAFQNGGNVTRVGRLSAFITRDDEPDETSLKIRTAFEKNPKSKPKADTAE